MESVLKKVSDDLFERNIINRSVFNAYLKIISKEEANLLYQVFVAMVVYSLTELCEFCTEKNISLNWLPEVSDITINRFVASFITIGDMMEKLADCLELDEKERCHKWRENDAKLHRISVMHSFETRYHEAKSRFLFRSRRKNKLAYHAVRRTIKKPVENWEILLKYTIEDISTQPLTFWSQIQVSKLSVSCRRAIVYKLEEVKNKNFLPDVAKSLLKSMNTDLFLEEFSDCTSVRLSCCFRRRKINVTW